MIDFSYERAETAADALNGLRAHSDAKLLGGGTNLVDLMREDIEQPRHLVDVTGISRGIEETPRGLRIGAAVTNTELANEPRRDPTRDTEFSQRDLMLAYQRGAEAFGWNPRPPASQRERGWLIGQGVATAYYPYYRMAASVRLRLDVDGSAVISTSAHEMGMGTATVQIQHAAQRLGLPRDKVSFEYGDSDLPETPMAGGSNQTASLVAGVTAAIEKAQRELLDMTSADSPLSIARLEEVDARAGGMFLKSDPTRGESYTDILRRAGQSELVVEAAAPRPWSS